jgi:hypothetical protein
MEWNGQHLAGPWDFADQFDVTASLRCLLEAEAMKDGQKIWKC